VLPKLAPYNQLLLVPALILLWDSRHGMASMGALARSLNKATLACLLWQWIAAFALGVLSLVLPLSLLGRFSGMPLYTVYALPVVVWWWSAVPSENPPALRRYFSHYMSGAHSPYTANATNSPRNYLAMQSNGRDCQPSRLMLAWQRYWL